MTPIGKLVWEGGEVTMGPADDAGPVAAKIREQLLAIQMGSAKDEKGWLTQARVSMRAARPWPVPLRCGVGQGRVRRSSVWRDAPFGVIAPRAILRFVSTLGLAAFVAIII